MSHFCVIIVWISVATDYFSYQNDNLFVKKATNSDFLLVLQNILAAFKKIL